MTRSISQEARDKKNLDCKNREILGRKVSQEMNDERESVM